MIQLLIQLAFSLLMRRSFCVGAVGDFTSVDYFLPPGICQGDAFITLLAGIQLSFHRLLYGEIAKAPGRRILVPRRFIGNKIGSSKLSKHCVGQMDRLPVRTQKQHIKIPLRYFHQFSNEHTPSNPDKPAPIFSPFCNIIAPLHIVFHTSSKHFYIIIIYQSFCQHTTMIFCSTINICPIPDNYESYLIFSHFLL